jgi:hypothetical protein
MTQALNLALLANNVNTSGQLNGATGIYGTIPVSNLPTVTPAYGGTGLTSTPTNGQVAIGNGTGFTLTTLTAGSGIAITNSAGGISIATSGGSGSVTSVATGNGLQGGTITTSGTLSLAAPGYNTVGSYTTARGWSNSGGTYTYVAGSNYSAGYNSPGTLTGETYISGAFVNGAISGTWRMMNYTNAVGTCGGVSAGPSMLVCRVA